MSRDRKRNRRDRDHHRNDHRDHKRNRNRDSLTAASFSDDPIISGGDSNDHESDHDGERHYGSRDDHREDDGRRLGSVVYSDDSEHSLGGSDSHHDRDDHRDHLSLMTAPDPLA